MLQKVSKCEVKAKYGFLKVETLVYFGNSGTQFYVKSNVNSNNPKMSFLAILEVLNFDFSPFEQLSSPKFTKMQSSETLKWPKMTFLDRLN